MHLWNEELMMGIQYHWWFVADTLEHTKNPFQFFFAFDGSMRTFMSKSNFSLLSSFPAQFEQGCKWVGRSKMRSQLNLNMVYRDPVWKQEKFYLGPTTSKLCVLFWALKIKMLFRMGYPLLNTTSNQNRSRVSIDHKF